MRIGVLEAANSEQLIHLFELLFESSQVKTETNEAVDFVVQITLTKEGRVISACSN
jgi:hypothetical protein